MIVPDAIGLPALEAELARQLSLIGHGGADWTRARHHPDGHVHDVVIVGGGQSGLAAAFGLLRERVSNILVIDENPAGYEGPWDTYARAQGGDKAGHRNAGAMLSVAE